MKILGVFGDKIKFFLSYWVFTSPQFSIAYLVFMLLSFFLPGTSGSRWAEELAQEMKAMLDSEYYGYKSMAMRQMSTMKEYRERVEKISTEERDYFDKIVAGIEGWTHDKPSSVRRLKLMMQHSSRQTRKFTAKEDGENLKKALQSYPPEVVNAMYQFLGNYDTENKTTLYLVGPHGTGKSTLVKRFAQELNLPLVRVKISDGQFLEMKLFGSPASFGNACLGIIPEFLANVDQYPGIIFFDEIDKLCKGLGGNEFWLNFLLTLIGDEDESNIISDGLGGMKIPLSKMMIIFAGNEEINTKNELLNKAFAERFTIINFPVFGTEEKRKIVANTIKESGLEEDSPEWEEMMKLVDDDESDGVRILLKKIKKYLASHKKRAEGWNFS